MITDISTVTENQPTENQPTAEVTMATSTPSGMQETTDTPHIIHIASPPSEMMKISDMLKETFRDEIELHVDSVVKGVLKGL